MDPWQLEFHDWDFDDALLDFLGTVVCSGFGLPTAWDTAQKLILVGSNDLQSLSVANIVCSAEVVRKRARRGLAAQPLVGVLEVRGVGGAVGLRRVARPAVVANQDREREVA